MLPGNEPVFVLSGVAVAHGAEGRREGAHHQLLILIRAQSLDAATPRSIGVALRYGFQNFRLEKADRLDVNADEVEEDYLRNAILKAQEAGQAIIVYDQELPPSA